MYGFAQVRLMPEIPVDHHFRELDVVEELVQMRNVHKKRVRHVFLHRVRAFHVELLAVFDKS